MKRILIIGTSGSGKSSLAAQVAQRLGLPFFASDHFYWEPGWKLVSLDEVHARLAEIVCREAWVLDGNFDNERELVWKSADCIVWLDYSFATILWRVASRNLRWLVTRQVTWSGNRMTWSQAISGIRHAVKSYSLKRRLYPGWQAELSGVACHRFHNSREAQAWLQSLG